LNKLKIEKAKFEREKRLKEKPWESRSKNLDEELKNVMNKETVAIQYRVKSAITTIVSKSLNKKNISELTQEDINKVEPFIQQVLNMFKVIYKEVI